MGKLYFLGTGAALPSVEQEHASLMFESNGAYLLVDASGLPYRKMLALGLTSPDFERLQHIIITHRHIDHCLGLPSLIECLWIAGRDAPLHIYALKTTLELIVPLLDLWQLRSRARNFPILIHPLDGEPNELVVKTDDFEVRTSPTKHAAPSIATKIILPDGTTTVYSSDTAPCAELVTFARGSDYFLLECNYCDDEPKLADLTGHIHSRQWGEVATAVGARYSFVTHHSNTADCSNEALRREIAPHFRGRINIPRDFDVIDLI